MLITRLVGITHIHTVLERAARNDPLCNHAPLSGKCGWHKYEIDTHLCHISKVFGEFSIITNKRSNVEFIDRKGLAFIAADEMIPFKSGR